MLVCFSGFDSVLESDSDFHYHMFTFFILPVTSNGSVSTFFFGFYHWFHRLIKYIENNEALRVVGKVKLMVLFINKVK